MDLVGHLKNGKTLFHYVFSVERFTREGSTRRFAFVKKCWNSLLCARCVIAVYRDLIVLNADLNVWFNV